MKTKGQRYLYLWFSLLALVAIASHVSLRWSLVGLITFLLAYSTKGIRRSP
jgi:hypothetical protein